jgi:hypothetical protein
MKPIQADLFTQDNAARKKLSESEAIALRERLEAIVVRLENAEKFPWSDPLDAIHEENRFQRGIEKLGEDGAWLWERFDKAMDRLYDTQD